MKHKDLIRAIEDIDTGLGWRVWLICLLLVAVPLIVYWQVQDHAFISYDDGLYVTRNFHLGEIRGTIFN